METTKLSSEALELRRKYHREKQREYTRRNPNARNDYWERKAAAIKKETEVENTDEVLTMCFSRRQGSTDASYAKGLFESNKSMISELKRLQNIIYEGAEKNQGLIEYLEHNNKHLKALKKMTLMCAISLNKQSKTESNGGK
jgi:hypothetical protein